jgi:hypothetical protein
MTKNTKADRKGKETGVSKVNQTRNVRRTPVCLLFNDLGFPFLLTILDDHVGVVFPYLAAIGQVFLYVQLPQRKVACRGVWVNITGLGGTEGGMRAYGFDDDHGELAEQLGLNCWSWHVCR